MRGYLSVVMVAGLLVGCAQRGPTLEQALAEAGVDEVDVVDQVDTTGAVEDVADDGGDERGAGDGEDPEAGDAEAGDAEAGDPEAGGSGGVRAAEVWEVGAGDDPFAVPEVIDEQYVSLVINELLAIVSDALRAVLADEDPGGVHAERVHREVYGPARIDARLNSLDELFVQVEGRWTQRPLDEFGAQRFDLLQLVSVDEGCVTAYGHYDLSETAVVPYPPEMVTAVVISRHEPVDPDLNPVGWRIWDVSVLASGGALVAPEELDEFVGLEHMLDVQCTGQRRAG